MCIDRDGRLWCGTWSGLCWLDGDRFRPFEADVAVAGQRIMFLSEDPRGWLWMGGWVDSTRSTVCGYWDGSRYTDLASDFEAATDGGTGSCWGISEDEDSTVWFAAGSVVRWTEGKLEHVDLPHRSSSCIAAHPEGGVWHSSGDLVGIWHDGTYEALDLPISGYVRKILADRQGRTCFCLEGSAETEVGFASVNSFCEDREGGLWFATCGGGLTRFDPAGPFVLSIADGLSSNQLARVAEDGSHRLWLQFSDLMVANKSLSLGYLETGQFHALPDAVDYETDLLLTADGTTWMAGRKGVGCWHEGHLETVIDMASDDQRIIATCLACDRQGRLLVGHWKRTPNGESLAILRLDDKSSQILFEMEQPGGFAAAILCMRQAVHGLWFAVGAITGQGDGYGLGFLDDDDEVRWYFPANGLVHACIEALHIDCNEVLWIATLGASAASTNTRLPTTPPQKVCPTTRCAASPRMTTAASGSAPTPVWPV